MPEVDFTGLLIVSGVAFLAPLLTGLLPRLRLPSVVLEIVAGIVIGPSVLGWVEPDEAIRTLSVLGLTFLLFLSGLEVEPRRFKGRFLRISAAGLLFSVALSLGLSHALSFAGLIQSPLLVAIILSATSLGLVVSVLKDVDESDSDFGQLTIASSSMSDFAGVILLSLLFSQSSAGAGAQAVLLAGFLALVVVVGLAIAGAQHSISLSRILVRLQDTTAQIRVRGAVVLLVGFLALAQGFGLEV
ncbi:MAG: cation:proton antiporter, partial [Actinomycetota bacterium]|nr:cation:proton antiporter [Actinomycetota bacterium]